MHPVQHRPHIPSFSGHHIAQVAEGCIFPRLQGAWIDLSTTGEDEVKRLGPLAKQQGIDCYLPSQALTTAGSSLYGSSDKEIVLPHDYIRVTKNQQSGIRIGDAT